MRCAVRVLLLAAIVVGVGCSLFRDPRVKVADIAFISAPDTIRADSVLGFTVHADLGHHSEFVLDHVDTSRSRSQFEIRVWSRDVSRKGYATLHVVTRADLTYQAYPAGSGSYHIIGHQPDGSITKKTITVLP